MQQTPQQQDEEASVDRPSNSPPPGQPGTPSASTRSPEGSEQAKQAPDDLALLARDLARARLSDPGSAKDSAMAPQGVRFHQLAQSAMPAGPSPPSDANTDTEASTDGWQSSVSDAEGLGPADRGRSDVIDRIMKSFCASLDSKIAVLKVTDAQPAVKKKRGHQVTDAQPLVKKKLGHQVTHAQPVVRTEPGHEPVERRQPSAAEAKKEQTVADREAVRRPKRSAAVPESLLTSRNRTRRSPPGAAPGSGPPRPAALAAAPAQAAPAAPAPSGPAAAVIAPSVPVPVVPRAPAPAPALSPTPKTEARVLPQLRAASRASAPPPPPPPPPAGVAKRRGFGSLPPAHHPSPPPPPPPPPASSALIPEELLSIGGLRERDTQQRASIPGSRLPAAIAGGSLVASAAPQAEVSAAYLPGLSASTGSVGRQPAASRRLDTATTDQVVSITEQTRATRRWPSRLLDRVRGSSSSSATASVELSQEAYDAEDDEEEEEEEDQVIGSAILRSDAALPAGYLSAAPVPQLVHAVVPEPPAVDLRLAEPGAPLLQSGDFGAGFQGVDFFGAPEPAFEAQPPFEGGWQEHGVGGGPYARAPSFPAPEEIPPAELQLPQETLARKQSVPSTKRATGLEEPQNALADLKQEADGDGRRKKARRAPSDTALSPNGGGRKFACPYFKRNPKKYHKWTSCPGPGWDEVHRVKTHLYRRHPLPIQCPRCWEPFKADSHLQAHLQQDPPCAIQGNRTLQEGFTKDQEKKLRSRKKTHADMTDEDKWREIYMVLFPDDDQSAIRSPYYSESDGEGESRRPSTSGELEDYATFIRREMPTLVRRELETLFRDEFRDVEERVRPRIAEIVLNLQPRLLGLYKQSQMPLSEYGPQQHRDATGSGSEPALTPLLSQSTDSGPGTGPSSTPDAALQLDFFPGSEPHLGLYGGNLDANWGAFYPAPGVQTQSPEMDAGLGLNWDFEFDKLLNPALLLQPGQAQ